MTGSIHIRVYRRLCSGYPQAFRREYVEDLTAIFALQLAELGVLRCWLRTIRDLLITVPTQRLEPRMKRLPSSSVTVACLALAVGGTMAAVVVGTSLYAVLLLFLAGGCVTVAVLSRRAAKPAVAPGTSGAWKKFLVAGGLLLAVMIVLMNLPSTKDQELSGLGWSLMMLTLLLSFTLIGAGVVLGATRLMSNRRTVK